MQYLTADPHFYGSKILIRENRPFSSPEDFVLSETKKWNTMTTQNDIIYCIGDFIDYSSVEPDVWDKAIALPEKFIAKIELLIGNNEQRLINDKFDGDMQKFREECLKYGFYDVKYNDKIKINQTDYFLTHYPVDHSKTMATLFGHIHKAQMYKPYGINVGLDLNGYNIYSEKDIVKLMEQKQNFWDKDPNICDTEEYKQQIL